MLKFGISMRQFLLACLLCCVIASAFPAASAQPSAQDVIPIAEARSLPEGSRATIEGSITAPAGDFSSFTFNQGFNLEDGSGGIYVAVDPNLGFNFHELVRVRGTVQDDGFGLLILAVSDPDGDVDRLPGSNSIDPQPVATGDVSDDTEGRLVEVTGVITRPVGDDRPFGFSVFIDDGSGETQVFIPVSTGVNALLISWLQVGQRIRAVGVGGQFLTQFEVLPRFHGDLHKANN